MTTKSLVYDHPTYTVRQSAPMGEGGGAASTQYAKFAAFTALKAFSAQVTVTVAGTSTDHAFTISQISGTATTSRAKATLGTSAAGTTTNVTLAASGGLDLAQGDVLVAINGTDTAGKAAIAYEYGVAPESTVTS
jgi:hypothetical protein